MPNLQETFEQKKKELGDLLAASDKFNELRLQAQTDLQHLVAQEKEDDAKANRALPIEASAKEPAGAARLQLSLHRWIEAHRDDAFFVV